MKIDFKGTGEIASVDDVEAAKALFEEYDIPYHFVTKGENEGKIRAKKITADDMAAFDDFCEILELCGCGDIIENPVVFRDVCDDLIFCFSPHEIPFEKIVENGRVGYRVPKVMGLECDIRSQVICKGGVVTFVFS